VRGSIEASCRRAGAEVQIFSVMSGEDQLAMESFSEIFSIRSCSDCGSVGFFSLMLATGL
jgi:hypothetical protein